MDNLFSYRDVIVESFMPLSTSGRHGDVHIRPIPGQVFSPDLFVECSKRLSDTTRHPLGTKFKIRAKLACKLGGTDFLYSYFGWKYDVVTDEAAEKFIKGLKKGMI